jgi:uridine kinase
MQPKLYQSLSTWQQPLPVPASPARTALLARVAAHILATSPHRLRIGIDGLTASGKTSIGHELAAQIVATGRTVLRASLDDFKRPWRDRHLYERESAEGYYRRAFDYAAVEALLLVPMANGGTGRIALCSIDPLTQIDHSAFTVDAPSNAVLIVDGVFAFRPTIDHHWDIRIWVDVAEDLAMGRGMQRDGPRDGLTHQQRYLPSARIYIAEANPISRADIVIDNTDFAAPRLLRGP